MAASIAKNAAGDRGERGREAVHVVEQVEGVRHADEPDERRAHRDAVVVDDLDREAARQHGAAAAATCAASFTSGPRRAQVVDEPDREQERAPPRMPASSPLGSTAPERERRARRRRGSRRRCRSRRTSAWRGVPAVGGRQRATSRRARPVRRGRVDHERRDGKSARRCRRAHGFRRSGPCKARVWSQALPTLGRMTTVYADLFRYRELFASLFRRDLRAKYRGSALGSPGRSRTRSC